MASSLESGIKWAIFPGNKTFAVEVQRTSDNGATAPATSAWATVGIVPPPAELFADSLPHDLNIRHYQMRHVRDGYTDGPWTTSKWAYPVFFDEGYTPESWFWQEGRRRGDTLYESDYVIQSSVAQQGPTGTQVITRGRQSGEALDGDTVTFSVNFDNPPMVLFKGGLSYQPASSMWSGAYSSTTPQYQDVRAVDLDAGGFDLYAKLVQKGAAASTGADFDVANSLTTDGQYTDADASTSVTGNSYTFHYKVQLDVTATGNPFDVTLDVDVACDNLTSGGTWTERGVTNYSVTAQAGSSASQTWSHEQKSYSVTGAASSADNMRMRVKASALNSPGPLTSTEGVLAIHGFVQSTGDADHGVTWQTTTEITASMTPSSGSDAIYWEALEV